MRRLIASVALALAVTTPAFAEKKPQPPMTAEQVKALVELKDDSLETVATFNTLAAKKRYVWSAPEAQGFLRANLNKKTGEVTYQVYSVVGYGREWRFYNRANFDAGKGPEQVELISISRDVVSCRYGCTYSEHVAFMLTEDQVWSIAALPVDTKWKYRLKSKAGVDSDVELEPGEFGGLIAAVDDYRATHKPLP